MNSKKKMPYEPAEITLVAFCTEDIMTASVNDDFFFGKTDNFIAQVLEL